MPRRSFYPLQFYRRVKYHYIVIFRNNYILQHLCENKDLVRKMKDSWCIPGNYLWFILFIKSGEQTTNA